MKRPIPIQPIRELGDEIARTAKAEAQRLGIDLVLIYDKTTAEISIFRRDFFDSNVSFNLDPLGRSIAFYALASEPSANQHPTTERKPT